MKIINHETKNPFASFLTGVALAVVLGSMVALSTSAFAMGGGGGGGGSAPAPVPEIIKVDDPVAKPRDEVAEVKKPVVEPDGKIPDDKTPVGELKTKEPEEKTLAIEDPDKDKTENKPDKRTTEFPGQVIEAVVGFAASASSVVEEGGLSEIQVRISKPLLQQVVLGVSAVGTATGDVDYKISSASLTIPAGATSGTITLISLDDDVDEVNETVTLTLAGVPVLPVGVVFGTTAHTVTIVDDDVAEVEETPEVVVTPGDETDRETEDETVNKPDERGVEFPKPEVPKVVEASVGFAALTSSLAENGGRLRLEVRSGVLSQPVTLDVVVGGTAKQGMDYTISSTSLTIPADAASAFLTLTGVDDAIYETDETITLVLKGNLPDGMKFGTDTHTVTIVDDEIVEATVGFERLTTQMEEGGNASLRVALSRPFPQPVTARLSMGGDTDAFELSPSTVTFQPGETSKIVVLRAVEDSDGADERVTLYLGGNFPDGVRYGEIHGHIVTIADNDVSGTVGFAAVNVATASEGDTVRLTVASSVAPAADLPISLSWSVSPAEEVDNAAGTATITSPARTGTFAINIVNDDVAETEERITITLSDGNSHDLFAIGGSATHVITIPANDQVAEATVGFMTRFSQVTKGATGNLQVALSNPLPQPLTLTLSEGGGGNVIDFSSGVLTFQPGETSKVASFTVRDTDNRYESAAIFLGGDLPEGVTLGAHNFHLVTILDTGNRPTAEESRIVAFTSATATAVEEGNPVSTTLTVTPPPASQVSIPVLVTSTGEVDYILKVGDAAIANEVFVDTTGRVVFTLKATGDADEQDGRVTVRLGTSPGSYTLGDQSSWAVTIKDNNESGNEDKIVNKPDERTVEFPNPEVPKVVEASVGFAASTSSLAEDGGHLRLEVRSGVLSQPVTLNVVVGGTAEQGTDYTISSTSLTIPADAASASLTLTGVDDAIYETDETITLVLKGNLPAGMKFGTDTHTVTIVDDEIEVVEATVGFERRTTQMEEGGNASLRVALSRSFPHPVTARLSMEGDADALEFSPGTVTFQPGETSKVVELRAVEDSDGADERVTLYLGDDFPDGVRHGEIHGHTVTIADNDVSGTVGFVTSNSRVNEPVSGAVGHTVNINVLGTLPASAFDLTVNVAGGTASGNDFTLPHTVVISGAGTTSVPLNILADVTPEFEETIVLTLAGDSLPSGVSLGANTTHTVVIPANDNTIAFDTLSPSVIIEEGDIATIAATIDNPIPAAATVTVTSGGSAVRGTDYRLSVSGGSLSGNTWTLPTGMSDATLIVIAVGNSVVAENKTLTLEFTGANLPDGWSVPSSEFGIIIANDAVVGFATASSVVHEGDTTKVPVKLSRALQEPLTLALTHSEQEYGSHGLQPGGFSVPDSVTFAPGRTEAVFEFATTEDADDKNKDVVLFIAEDVGSHLPESVTVLTNMHTVTIIDNDITEDETVDAGDELPPEFVPAVAKFATRYSEVNEGDSVELQVELSKPLPKTVALDVYLQQRWGTSALPDDVDSLPSTVTFPQGETTASVSFTVVDDTIDESNERLRVRLRSRDEFLPYVRAGFPRRHVVTIVDDDSDVEVGFGTWHYQVNEGEDLSLRVELSRPLPQPLTLSVSGSAGSGDDIVLPGPLTIEQGERRKSFVVAIIDDAIPEDDETVTLSLEGELPDGAEFGRRTHTVAIIDNDSDVEVGFATSNSWADEGNSLFLPVVLSRPLPQPLTLSVSGSAGSGDDIVLPGPLTIEQGEIGESFVVAIVDDAVFEGDETVTLSLEGELPDGVEFGDRTHVVAIDDNDTVNATVGFAKSASEVVEGEDLSVQVELSHALPQSITLLVNENFYDDIRVPGTLTFEPGETSKALEISTVDNYVFDEDRTFRLLLRESWPRLPEGVRFGAREHIITMTDDNDDMTVGFASSSTYVGEDVGSVAVAVVLGRPLLQPLRVFFESDNPQASNEPDADIHERTSDIYSHSVSLTFEPGETSKLFLFDLADDRLGESTEYYAITLEGDLPEGMKFGRRTHTIYTSDNDRAGEGIEDIHINEHDGGEILVQNEEQVSRIETKHYYAPDQNSTISIENLGIVDTDVVARIFDFHNSGEIVIKNATQGTVGGNVIGKQHGNGKISVENRGSVDGDIRAVQFRDGVTEIVNHGNVGEDIEVTHYGDGKISIENRGTIDRVEADHYGDSEILITNYEAATATAIIANHYGSGEISITNRGTAEVNARHKDDSGVVRFAGNINSGSWNELTGGTIRLGVVDFKRSTGEDVSTLEIDGDYEGLSDTRLNFHVGPDGLDYGHLWIDGDVTGQSRVSLVVDGEVAADTDFDLWELIEVDGEAQANSFYGAETVGAFDYVLEYEREGSRDHAWHFVNRGLSEVASQSSQTVDEIIKNMITPTAANPGERDEYWCLWGEQLGSHTVLGFEVPVTRLAGGDMFVGTSVARNSSTSSNISVESQITALAASWERGGLYVGGQTRLARFISDVSTGRLSVVQNNGGTGISTSVETGYWFDVMNFRISPQVQLTWTRVGFDDFVGPHGELVSLEDGDRVTGQLGLSWDGEWQGAEGFGRLYGGMNLRGNLDGKTSVNVSGVSIANEQDDLSIDGKLGFSYEWNEGYAVRGEVSALRSDDADEVRVNLGVRVDF